MTEDPGSETQLLDLPDELLARCLSHECLCNEEDENGLQPSLATCHRMLDLLLGGQGKQQASLFFTLQSTPRGGWLKEEYAEEFSMMRASLLRAASLFPRLAKLKVELKAPSMLLACSACRAVARHLALAPRQSITHPEWLNEAEQAQLQLAQLLAAPPLMQPGWLPNVTHLQLQRQLAPLPVQHPLVPLYGAQACPNLRHLQLQLLNIAEQQGQTAGVQLPQLQQLTLGMCWLGLPPDTLQQQLQAMPGLQHLSISGAVLSHPQVFDPKLYVAAIAQAVSQQLVSLDLDFYGPGWPATAAAALLNRPWPLLQKLRLFDATVADAQLELMLQQLPQLQQLDVEGFRLQADFRTRQCSWQEVLMRVVDVASVARLPLSSVTRLCLMPSIQSPNVRLAATASAVGDLQLTAAAAVAAAAACGGLQLSDEAEPIIMGDKGGGQNSQLLATLPLLRHMPKLRLKGVHVNSEVLTAISRDMPVCTRLTLTRGCSFEAGIWGSLVALLPHVKHLDISWHAADMGLQQLTALCVAATHPISVIVGAELRAQLRSEVRKAGHGLVTVR